MWKMMGEAFMHQCDCHWNSQWRKMLLIDNRRAFESWLKIFLWNSFVFKYTAITRRWAFRVHSINCKFKLRTLMNFSSSHQKWLQVYGRTASAVSQSVSAAVMFVVIDSLHFKGLNYLQQSNGHLRQLPLTARTSHQKSVNLFRADQ